MEAGHSFEDFDPPFIDVGDQPESLGPRLSHAKIIGMGLDAHAISDHQPKPHFPHEASFVQSPGLNDDRFAAVASPTRGRVALKGTGDVIRAWIVRAEIFDIGAGLAVWFLF